jgi:hypothetical protein
MERETREITSLGEWLTWREKDITASRIAALFGAHPYLTRDQLSEIMRGTAMAARHHAQCLHARRPRPRRRLPAAVKLRQGLGSGQGQHLPPLPEHHIGATPDFGSATTGCCK